MDMKKMCIYIHIPFCKKRCYYCSFLSCSNAKYINGYFKALQKEIISCAGKFKDYVIQSVYIGGGTPSYPSEQKIEGILSAVKNNYYMASDAEISIEANPESLTENKIE